MTYFSLLNTEPWVKDALCASRDTEMFYSEKGRARQAEKAKSVCRQCPVIDQCLEYALARNEEHGVWGGTTHKDRQRIRRERKWPRKQRSHCDSGHEFARFGRRADGRCRQCANEWDRARRRDGIA